MQLQFMHYSSKIDTRGSFAMMDLFVFVCHVFLNSYATADLSSDFSSKIRGLF